MTGSMPTSLARLGRVDPQSLFPIEHRSTQVRQDLVVLRARDTLVQVRTQLINATRGLVKSMGARLPKCSSPSFPKKVEEALPCQRSRKNGVFWTASRSAPSATRLSMLSLCGNGVALSKAR